MKVQKDDALIDGGKSAMITMRRRPLADRSRLELRQPERHVSDSDMLITEVADAAGLPQAGLRVQHNSLMLTFTLPVQV